jgi:hypothetical protein
MQAGQSQVTCRTAEFLDAQLGKRAMALKKRWIDVPRFTACRADIVDGYALPRVVNDGPCQAKGLVVGMG